MTNSTEALISKVKKQTESFDTVVLKEDEAKALVAALEQARQEKSHLEYRLKNVQDAFLAGDERALRAERRVSELEKTLRGTEESLIAAVDQVAELEVASFKFVNLPDAFAIRSGHPINENERSVMIPKDCGNWFSRLDIEHALRVAGVKFEGGK